MLTDHRTAIVPASHPMPHGQFCPLDRSILADAWHLHGQILASGQNALRRYQILQALWLALSLGAVLLALLTSVDSLMVLPLNVGIVGLVITAVMLFVSAGRLRERRPWIGLQQAADSLGRGIYLYRTVLQQMPQRHQWLIDQLQQVQQQVSQTGQFVADIPLSGDDSPSCPLDERFCDSLLAQGYLAERLAPRLCQLTAQLTQQQRQQRNRWIAFALSSGLGVVLPAMAAPLNLWVAFPIAASIIAGLWLNKAETTVPSEQAARQYLELSLIRDRWLGQLPDERSASHFFKLVLEAEAVIVGRPCGILDFDDTDPVLLQAVTEIPADLDDALQTDTPQPQDQRHHREQGFEASAFTVDVEATEPEPSKGSDSTPPISIAPANGLAAVPGDRDRVPSPDPIADLADPLPTVPRGAPHAFVVMPFGRKQAPNGSWIDFNHVYEDLIKPALLEAGFEPFRADEETSSGDILTDMFQELLLADLVIADLSIDNANVFYEVGIRHAMRKRGIVHIQSGRAYMPFDIFNVRTIPYHCDDTGCPDPAFLRKDKQAIVNTVLATWESDRNTIHSPIFNLLDGLVEPDRKSLRTPLATGYWQEYTSLQQRLQVAQRQKRIGDVLLLTEEVKNSLVKEDVLAYAGRVLRDTGNSALALKQYRQGLDINPDSVEFRCEEAYHLSRLQQPNEAIVKLEDLLDDEPQHLQAMSYLARIYKDLWKSKWIELDKVEERIQAAYGASHFLQKSIENYLRAFRLNQNSYYPGINAFTLTAVLDYLAECVGPTGDPDEEAYRQQMMMLKGAVEFCLRSQMQQHPNDFWAAASLGDLAVCTASDPTHVAIAYKKALTALWNQKFALQSILDQLYVLRLLGFRPDYVAAGQTILQEELQRFERHVFNDSDGESSPSPVFMFSGHMVDRPDRPKPRFPAAMESEAKQRIDAVLDQLDAQSGYRAICGGVACGGDILFLEACLSRGMIVDVYLPFDPPEFIQDSVSFAGDRWVERFYAIANHPDVTIHLQTERLGKVPNGEDPYRRNNRWTLYNALTHRIDYVRLIVLWNGQGGDGPGGTNDMVQQVRQLGGVVEHIDTTKFDYWKAQQAAAEEQAEDSQQPSITA